MGSSECGQKKAVFRTAFGWAGVALSEAGVCWIVLPKRDRKTVERELKAASVAGDDQQQSDRAGSTRYKAGINECPLSEKGGAGQFEKTLKRAICLLEGYFSGKAVVFDLPLDIRYYTAFQQAVWRAAMAIPSGETRSYAWVAARIRKPKAARAVGQAMGANPIPIMIP